MNRLTATLLLTTITSTLAPLGCASGEEKLFVGEEISDVEFDLDGEATDESGDDLNPDMMAEGDGDGDGDGDPVGDGDGDMGDGDGDMPLILPGDDCDPFSEACLDIDGLDYECQQNLRLGPNNEPETFFQCTVLNSDLGDGEYGSPCQIDPYSQCATGFWCRSSGNFPPGDCEGPACCIELCYLGQDCGLGKECQVQVWAEALSDYLDEYDGIGTCG